MTPTQLKKFVTGNSEKSIVIKSVYKRFGIDTDDDNTAAAPLRFHVAREV